MVCELCLSKGGIKNIFLNIRMNDSLFDGFVSFSLLFSKLLFLCFILSLSSNVQWSWAAPTHIKERGTKGAGVHTSCLLTAEPHWKVLGASVSRLSSWVCPAPLGKSLQCLAWRGSPAASLRSESAGGRASLTGLDPVSISAPFSVQH